MHTNGTHLLPILEGIGSQWRRILLLSRRLPGPWLVMMACRRLAIVPPGYPIGTIVARKDSLAAELQARDHRVGARGHVAQADVAERRGNCPCLRDAAGQDHGGSSAIH